VISGLATTDVGNDTQGFFFRLNLEATNRVFEMWSFMNKFWISKIAVIYEDSEFGRNAELAFKDLVRDTYTGNDYISIAFESPKSPYAELDNLIEERPEVIGLFCDREDIQRLYRDILLQNKSGVPYYPYFFSLIDITSIGEGLNNFYFPSLQEYLEDGASDSLLTMREKIPDEVYILGEQTGKLLLGALRSKNGYIDLSTPAGRVKFRNRVVGFLRGDSKGDLDMNFLKMKNLGPPYLYRINNGMLTRLKHQMDINWITMIRSKIRLVYAAHSYKLILNLLIILVLTVSVSTIEIRRSFPKQHVKIYLTPVYYYYLLAHLGLVLFLYIYLAETGRINYSDTLMTIIITITPSAFFKTTLFETRSGRSIGLEEIYKRIMASIDNQVMISRYKKLVGLENVIAYSNSENSMRSALLRVYRNNPSKVQSAKLIQKMEEDLNNEKDYMNRRRAAARLIMRQFDREQLKAEGFVPSYWDYENSVDPVILIRQAAKKCAEDESKRTEVLQLLEEEKAKLKRRNEERYEEIMDVHEKELSITMSKEGELLVKLRLLLVLRGFNLQWIKEHLISDDHLPHQVKNETDTDDTLKA
jgi:hypothetical protein